MDGRYDTALKGALITVLTLFGGILVGVALGNLVFRSLPGHSVTNPEPTHVIVTTIPLLIGLLAGGAGWGLLIGRLSHRNDGHRMAVAGILGFAPVTLLMTFGLLWLEPIAIERIGSQFPIHRVFTFFFVPTAFLIAGISASALGIGLRDKKLARSLFWRVGLAAALTFLVVNLAMEAAGWVVGAPRAAERLTMLVVMSLGNIGAALAGGRIAGVDACRVELSSEEVTSTLELVNKRVAQLLDSGWMWREEPRRRGHRRGHGHRRHSRRRRWFESGEIRYVILNLLKEKPMHGYEVMKALSYKTDGWYEPSPGTVYPTLQWRQ